jgi:hypothetical protein
MLALVARMLEYDPAARITLGDSLKHPFFERLSGGGTCQAKLEDVSRHVLRLQI